MILHVTFTDGSNPWVSLPADRQTIAKLWRQWMKNHPDTAQPVARCGRWRCFERYPGEYVVFQKGTIAPIYEYQHLGHALRALERLGGDTKWPFSQSWPRLPGCRWP